MTFMWVVLAIVLSANPKAYKSCLLVLWFDLASVLEWLPMKQKGLS